MKTNVLAAVFAVVLGGCGSKGGGGDEVIAKVGELEKSMCACADEACAKKVREEHAAYVKGGAMKKPTDKQMSTVMDTERKIDACEAKFVLSETGTMSLDQLKKGLASAKQKVAAGQYAQAGFDCSPSSADSFRKDYGAFAESKPDIKAFLDEYGAYCKEGMHIEAATTLATKAEASRTATPTGSIPECGSPDVTLAEVKLKDVAGGPEKLAPLKARYDKACGH
ncbi:MAG: hypothetical protein JWP01_273 [Myxococcales bacterium]|nr:hypothetical protein [Myxococcales bacterium]